MAQEDKQTNKTEKASIQDKTSAPKAKTAKHLKLSNQSASDAKSPKKDKEGLYHIMVTTEKNERESLWVELNEGEQKYVLIKLDNSSQEKISIQLNDDKRTEMIKIPRSDEFSRLVLQPISF
jgi:hypothetical protein